MKRFSVTKEGQYKVARLLFCLVGLCGFFMPGTAVSGNSVADEIISLNVTDRPLGEVLDIISSAADCQFVYDMNWQDYPVTAIFDEEPLYRVLKLVFRNINNAVIYGANRTIRIIIYDEATSSDTAGGQSNSPQSSPEPSPRPAVLGEATAPQAEVESSEASGQIEDVEELPEADAETGSEESQADAKTGSEESETDAQTGSEESETDLENAGTPAEEAPEAETGEPSAELVPEEKDSESDTVNN